MISINIVLLTTRSIDNTAKKKKQTEQLKRDGREIFSYQLKVSLYKYFTNYFMVALITINLAI